MCMCYIFYISTEYFSLLIAHHVVAPFSLCKILKQWLVPVLKRHQNDEDVADLVAINQCSE